MRIALLISGRLTRYEECLLPMLENCSDKHTIEVFASINDSDCEYYINARKILARFLHLFSFQTPILYIFIIFRKFFD